jgi:hypothetical protein
MSQPEFGVTLDLLLDARPNHGGRSRPIVDDFRPLCIIDGRNGESTIGLCELHLDAPISPGESGVGRLSFDVTVSEDVRELLRVGSVFDLAEGRRRIARVEVRGIDP